MTDVSRQSVWLFTREPESVRLSVQPGPAGFWLVIAGPGHAHAEFQFSGLENLERFRETYEKDLRARGFELQALTDRRIVDVASPRPPAAVERRR